MNRPDWPPYAVGERVRYVDRNGRLQTGRIITIEARWTVAGQEPRLSYHIEHPTYARRRQHVGARDIRS